MKNKLLMLAIIAIGLLGCKKKTEDQNKEMLIWANTTSSGGTVTLNISNQPTETINTNTLRFERRVQLKTGDKVTVTASDKGTKTNTVFEVGVYYKETLGSSSGNPATITVTIP